MSKYVIEMNGSLVVADGAESEEHIVETMVEKGALNFSIYELVGEYAPVVQKKETVKEENV